MSIVAMTLITITYLQSFAGFRCLEEFIPIELLVVIEVCLLYNVVCQGAWGDTGEAWGEGTTLEGSE